MNKRAVGNLGEDAACDALRREGCEILARNFRRPTGVIDVVARDRKTVVFVEVRMEMIGLHPFVFEGAHPCESFSVFLSPF